MILLLISLILLALKCFGIIEWSWWIVAGPAMLGAAFSYVIFIKTEIWYLREYNKQAKEEEPQE